MDESESYVLLIFFDVPSLDHDIVRIAAGTPNAQWRQARRLNDVKGFLIVAGIRTFGHHHRYREKRAGPWRRIAFDQRHQ